MLARVPQVASAQPRIDFKSRELQEGKNYLQRLMGSLVVSESGGSLSYEFPLAAPPGRGVSPSLSLVYSSSAGYSEYGYGWELTLPMIERDPSDGVPRYEDGDRFRFRAGFESRRLVLTTETTAGGWQVFREESEKSFSRYLFKDNRWRVLSPDGKRLELGNGPEARRGRSTRVLETDTAAWLASRLIDTHGNYVAYEYAIDRFQRPLLRKVRYTGNEPLGTAPAAAIDFTWVAHWSSTADFPLSHRRGYLEAFGVDRLAAVTVTAPAMATGTSPAMVPPTSPTSIQYTILYPSPVATRNVAFHPTSVQVGTSPPISFDYNQAWTAGTPFTDAGQLGGDALPTSLTLTESDLNTSRSRRVFVDVTGDGLPDIVDAEVGCANQVWWIWKNRGGTFVREFWPWPPMLNSNPDYCAIRISETSGPVTTTRRDFLDLTGDGIPDIVFFSNADLTVCRGNGEGFDPCVPWGAFPSGTSQQGVLRREVSVASGLTYTDVDMVDFNADGYVDRVVRTGCASIST